MSTSSSENLMPTNKKRHIESNGAKGSHNGARRQDRKRRLCQDCSPVMKELSYIQEEIQTELEAPIAGDVIVLKSAIEEKERVISNLRADMLVKKDEAQRWKCDSQRWKYSCQQATKDFMDALDTCDSRNVRIAFLERKVRNLTELNQALRLENHELKQYVRE